MTVIDRTFSIIHLGFIRITVFDVALHYFYVSPSMLCSGGVPGPRGVPGPGRVPGPRGVPDPRGPGPGVCAWSGGVPGPGGACSGGWVPAWSRGGGIPACTEADPPVDRILDTHF